MALLTVVADERALADAAAERIARLVEDAIAARGSALVSLTGGTTPRLLYAALADPGRPWRTRIEWPRVHLFWGDERHVPPDHPDSNFGMADDALVTHVPIPPAHVHRMRGELSDAADAARQYEEELRTAFAAANRGDRTFDVMLLGMGEDAHIASIFPASPLLELHGPQESMPGGGQRFERPERAANENENQESAPHQPRVAAVWAPHLKAWRITLTPAALLDSRAIVMIVSGAKKADAVRQAIEAPEDVYRYPAQLLRDAGDRVHWFIDAPAAARLRDAPRA